MKNESTELIITCLWGPPCHYLKGWPTHSECGFSERCVFQRPLRDETTDASQQVSGAERAKPCGPDCHYKNPYGFVHEADCPNG